MESDPTGLSAGSYSTCAYVNDNPIANIDPLGLCKVEIRFKRVPLVGWMGIYHAYVITTDPDGSENYFRGGPSGSMNWSSFWGNVATRYGKYLPNTQDWPTQPRPSMTLLIDGAPCACENKKFQDILDKIQNADIPYGPGERNSNSAVGTMLRDSGFRVTEGQLSVYAPQFDNQLPLIPNAW